MDFNWNIIEEIWNDFTTEYNMLLLDKDEHLLINKRQIYYAIEEFNNNQIHYRYVFYKLDSSGFGNDFRAVIPIESVIKQQISNPNFLDRLIKKKSITIKPPDNKLLNKKILDLIISMFNKHPDLKVNIGFSSIPTIQINEKHKVLELQTKKIPYNLKGIKEFQTLIKIIYNYLIKTNININP